ncbi:MAG TPA: hypothetical protein VKY32_03055 [Flavobacterium sp.]|nr:hypothetical protein [Flavobacterium sp.]
MKLIFSLLIFACTISYGQSNTNDLSSIKANVEQINSIAHWTHIDKLELWESAEGGEARFYYLNNQLEKIVTQHYGETFQLLTEYYLLDDELSFVFEKHIQYNRPFYYDEKAMKENNDTEAFDWNKSNIIEDRSYFKNGQLLQQTNNEDCGSSFSNDYLIEEQKRITENFERLIKLKKTQTL